MSNPKRHPEKFSPDHLGEQSVAVNSNKGKQMANKSNEEPLYIPPKGK
ncbi:acid-soluble spore protein N [Terrilactibacillus sp. BCM23-1]|uniref:Small, acid-soluble spore protein N n=1 Tax=Terrilactibacillus tamarindi TaxID=2599694 RepID=A0A6N8CLH8_9BACI|nr:acid-soluble spore protein N [Terrilactibacillus tamarindi]MTT30631.1 acid-soluble spore protein N [Terrilactibacillus tamarindi]